MRKAYLQHRYTSSITIKKKNQNNHTGCCNTPQGHKKYSFVAQAGIIVILNDPVTIHFKRPCWWKIFTQNVTIHGNTHSCIYSDELFRSFCRKNKTVPRAWCLHLHSSQHNDFLWMQLCILSPSTSRVFTKRFYFGFIWLHNILSILVWIVQMQSQYPDFFFFFFAWTI